MDICFKNCRQVLQHCVWFTEKKKEKKKNTVFGSLEWAFLVHSLGINAHLMIVSLKICIVKITNGIIIFSTSIINMTNGIIIHQFKWIDDNSIPSLCHSTEPNTKWISTQFIHSCCITDAVLTETDHMGWSWWRSVWKGKGSTRPGERVSRGLPEKSWQCQHFKSSPSSGFGRIRSRIYTPPFVARWTVTPWTGM